MNNTPPPTPSNDSPSSDLQPETPPRRPAPVLATRAPVPPDAHLPASPSDAVSHPPDAAAQSPDTSFAPVSAAEASALVLTPAQRTALERITAGQTMAASALAAGVHRATLYRWLQHDPHFAAAYNAWQQDAVATTRARLLALTDLAVTSLGRSLLQGDGHLALKLLTEMGLVTPPAPGPTDATDIRRDQDLRRKQENLERRQAQDRVLMDALHLPDDPYRP